MARIVPAPKGRRYILSKEQWLLPSLGLSGSDETLAVRGRTVYRAYAGSEDRATLASDPSAEAGGVQRARLGHMPGFAFLPAYTRNAINAIFFRRSSGASCSASFLS